MFSCHAREGGDPELFLDFWTPAFAVFSVLAEDQFYSGTFMSGAD
jgi:hypothetical protein